MSRIPFIGATYNLDSIRVDCQRCINFFPENVESGGAPNGEKGFLVQVPGLRRLATVGDSPIRAVYFTSTGRFMFVSGNKLYKTDTDQYLPVLEGTIGTYTGYVDICDNGTQAMIVDGAGCYLLSLETDNFYTLDTLPAANRCCYLDGYFIINQTGTGQFLFSALNDGLTWDSLDYTSAEGLPDDSIAVVVNQRQLWVFGTKSVEVFWNSGDPLNPLARVDGSLMDYGCGAAGTPQKFAGSIAWLTDNGQVMMSEGYSPKRISNFAVENAIRKCGDISTATAFSYKQNGHMFYVLQLPNTDSTWVFDVATAQWHERCELINGELAQWRASCVADAWGDRKVIGDSRDGRIYTLDPDYYTNDGDVLFRQRRSPHVTADLNRLTIDKFQLDVESGHGLDSGVDPQVMLRVSRDAGYTWGSERWTSLGGVGEYRTRAIWRQLGQARDWVFEVTVTDPVKATILGALVDGRPAVN